MPMWKRISYMLMLAILILPLGATASAVANVDTPSTRFALHTLLFIVGFFVLRLVPRPGG